MKKVLKRLLLIPLISVLLISLSVGTYTLYHYFLNHPILIESEHYGDGILKVMLTRDRTLYVTYIEDNYMRYSHRKINKEQFSKIKEITDSVSSEYESYYLVGSPHTYDSPDVTIYLKNRSLETSTYIYGYTTFRVYLDYPSYDRMKNRLSDLAGNEITSILEIVPEFREDYYYENKKFDQLIMDYWAKKSPWYNIVDIRAGEVE